MPDVFGRYELGELLGRGGMGEVYRARDTVRNRWVALKVLPPHLASDESFGARFRRESQLAAQLNEPHIIPIHDFGEIDGRLFIDMRLVQGRDLSSVLETGGPLLPEVAVDVIAQMAAALDAAHADGLVHRDVKPSNILLTGIRDDPAHVPFAYLVDFGIARSTGQDVTALTGTSGQAIGTLAYMSPERIYGQTGDGRGDVYALGCVLYEAVTGRAPFEGEPFALMYAHVNLPPPSARAVRPQVPPALDEVIATAMAKSADDRFATAGEFAAAARAATRVTGPTGPPPAARPADATVALPRRIISREQTPPPSGPTGAWSAAPTGPPGTPPPGATPPYAVAPLVAPPPGPPGSFHPESRRPPRRRLGWIALAAAVVLGLAALGVVLLRDHSSGSKAAGATGTATAVRSTVRSAVRDGGTLRWALASKITNFNGLRSDGTDDARTVMSALLPRPYHFDASGQASVDTDFFTSIEKVDDDPFTVEYKINPKAVWSDGTPITHRDFALQQLAMVSGSSGFEVADDAGYDAISSVERGTDDRDVVVTFSSTYSDWQALFSPLLPEKLTTTAEAFNSSWADAPLISAGPFRWTSKDATGYHLVRNTTWWGRDGRSKLDRIDFLPFADHDAAVAGLRRHQADYLNISGVNAEPDAATLAKTSGVTLRSSPGVNFRLATLNTSNPVLKDVRVRQAVLLAIDRAALAKTVVGTLPGGHDPLQNYFYVRGQQQYTDTCGTYCEHSVERAGALLVQAGWSRSGAFYAKNGTRLRLTVLIPTNSPYARVEAESMQTSLRAAGIELVLDTATPADVAAQISEGKYQIYPVTVFSSPFPLRAFGSMYDFNGATTATNPGAGGSTEVNDDLRAARVATDLGERDTNLNKASSALWANAAWLPLYQRTQVYAVVGSLVNLGAPGLGDVRFADIGFRA